MPKPLASRLSEGQILLAKDINTLFITDEGKPLEKRQIPWQSAPESIGYSYPYIVALQPPAKGSLEVRNPETLSLLQTISLPGAAQLHFPPPTVSLPHAGKGFHISSDRVVWKMGANDYDSQIDELVAQALQRDFAALYDYLVNRDIVWDGSEARAGRKWVLVSESGNRAFDADTPEVQRSGISAVANHIQCQLARLRRARLLAEIRIPTEGPGAVQLASRKWGLAVLIGDVDQS